MKMQGMAKVLGTCYWTRRQQQSLVSEMSIEILIFDFDVQMQVMETSRWKYDNDHVGKSIEFALTHIDEIMFHHSKSSEGSSQQFYAHLGMKTSENNGDKAESKRQEDHAEEVIFEDLRILHPVPSRQWMMDFRNIEKQAMF